MLYMNYGNALLVSHQDAELWVRRSPSHCFSWLAGLGDDASAFKKSWIRMTRHFRNLPEEKRADLFGADAGGLVVEGSCHAALMYGTVAPSLDESDVLEIAKAMIELHEPAAEPEKLKALVRSEPIVEAGPSWEQGYELAQEVFEELSHFAPDGERLEIELILDALGVDVRDLALSDGTIRGLAIAGPDFRPGIRVNVYHKANEHPSGRRFTLAHELCHLQYQHHGREFVDLLSKVMPDWEARKAKLEKQLA